MAEPIKYVQLDCHFNDDKFDFIEGKFGLKGFAIVVKLFQRIYGGQGYYCEWSDRISVVFARKIGADAQLVRDVVSAAIDEGFFDKTIYEQYGVLTSHGIQKRFYEVAKRRTVIFEKPEIVLFIPDTQKSDNANNSAPNVDNSAPNVDIEATSKVKRSKESKEKLSEAERSPAALTSKEDLIAEYGEIAVKEYEKRFDSWVKSTGAVRADRYTTVAKMLYQDYTEKGKKPPKGNNNRESSFDIEEIEKMMMDGFLNSGGD